jgi:hypothetical protein
MKCVSLWRPVLAVAVLCTTIMGQEVYTRSGPFSLHITEVRSLPTKGAGFGKGLILYGVNATGPEAAYLLYCIKTAPEAGRVYTATDEYVSDSLSWLHLWPVDRAGLNLPPGTKKKGRLYRVIIIQNIREGKSPDVACDIKTETALPKQ